MWQKAFNNELEKLSSKISPDLKTTDVGNVETTTLGEIKNFAKNLGVGAISSVASTLATHPTELKLYRTMSGDISSGQLLKQRLGKGLIGQSIGYGTAFYLKDKLID